MEMGFLPTTIQLPATATWKVEAKIFFDCSFARNVIIHLMIFFYVLPPSQAS